MTTYLMCSPSTSWSWTDWRSSRRSVGDGGGGALFIFVNNVRNTAATVFVTAFTCALTCASGTLLKPVGISKDSARQSSECRAFPRPPRAFYTLYITSGLAEKFRTQRQSRIFVVINKRFGLLRPPTSVFECARNDTSALCGPRVVLRRRIRCREVVRGIVPVDPASSVFEAEIQWPQVSTLHTAFVRRDSVLHAGLFQINQIRSIR